MDNENNSSINHNNVNINNNEINNNNISNNNIENIIKFVFSAIIHIIIICCIFSYSLKYSMPENYLINKAKNKNKNHKYNQKLKYRILNDKEDNNNITKNYSRQIIYNNSKNNIIDDEMRKYLNALLENLDSRFDYLRDFLSGKQLVLTKEAFFLEKEKQIFLTRLLQNSFSGTWEYFPYIANEEEKEKGNNISKTKLYYIYSSKNDFKIGKQNNGSVIFNFKRAIEMTTKQDAIAISMKNLEGNYIDNWIQHISYCRFNELNRTINKNNKKYYVKGEFTTSMIKGKLLNNKKKHNKKYECTTLAEMEFPLSLITLTSSLLNKTIVINNLSTIDPSNFTMLLSSTCGFRFKIKANIYDRGKDYINNKKNVYLYSYISIICSILYLIGVSCLTISLNRNENAISAISLGCYCQNFAWHSYCSITNIHFGFYFIDYFGTFCLVALFPLINFFIFDLRFFYFYWKIKKRLLSDREFIKLRLKFFGFLYFLLFFAFFSMTTFYTSKAYMVLLSIGLWTPQIIYNIKNNNKYIYPTIYIITNSLERIIYPLYFRGFKNNFINLKTDMIFIIFLAIYVIITIIILYLQIFIGARFMLPSKYQKKNLDFHKTEEELFKEIPDCVKEECVICLSPLIEESIQNNINKKNNIKNVNIVINNKNNNINIDNENSSDSPDQLKNESIQKSTNSSIDLINNSNSIKKENSKNENIDINNKNNNAMAIDVKKLKKNKQINICNKLIKVGKIIKIILWDNMFKFYKLKINLKDKKYMIIACGHTFHTVCLEKWFERKKECPSCRASMEDFI